VRSFVNTYAGSKEYEKIEGNLFGFLSQTGVVSGEYGLRDAYKYKKNALKEFSNSKDKDFLRFIANYGKYLDQRVFYEQKRTDEAIELMKRDII